MAKKVKVSEAQEKKFIELVESLRDSVSIRKEMEKKKGWYSHSGNMDHVKGSVKLDIDNHYLYVQWCSGGISGGSCWDSGDSDPHYARSGDAEPEFDDVDTVLTKICPTLSFLQYKQLMKIVTRDEYSENEYYGNCTNYTYKKVKLRDLLNELVRMELI